MCFPESGGEGKMDGRFAGGKKILFSLNSGWIERKIPGGRKESRGVRRDFLPVSSVTHLLARGSPSSNSDDLQYKPQGSLRNISTAEAHNGEGGAWSPLFPRGPTPTDQIPMADGQVGTQTHTVPLPCRLPFSGTIKVSDFLGQYRTNRLTSFL